MGRMTPADAAGRVCQEALCKAGQVGGHPAVYRIDATHSVTGEVRRRDVCMTTAPGLAQRLGHAFPPGAWR